ncbi:hypothetical protein NQ314_002886 [Rhamnusium bicolor]|uniref:Armadillo repeat-containing protein 8 n=1 Tax=Rhamnusium bicolor TaxID=1586634 RepID=A0AAV8ZNK3_9CUCU|nr:hypothetical protein NQ314_002886 [Rhamnusium bicolor]
MLLEMQPFSAFMNVESTRSYIDDLYSQDPNKCLASIICIKNSVIGSNRHKESVIAQGIVPRLIYLLKDTNTKIVVRIEAAVTIGSLAKGTEDHIELLINSGSVHILLDVLEENEPRLIDACLCCLRTLAQQNSTPITICSLKNLHKLLSFAESKESLQRQSCVASILSFACKNIAEQNVLCSVGAPAILASLLSVQNYSVRIPVITCLASMCWNNQMVANEIINTACKDIKVHDYLATLISRDQPTEIQLESARCLTNLHRAGAIPSYDPIITYRTLPCLVRLCQIEHLESHRALAADTLAYLTEVDSNLQQVAAISNQLVSALVELLKCPSIAARQAAFRYADTKISNLPSLKNIERDRRAGVSGRDNVFNIVGEAQKRPNDFLKTLRSDSFKTEFIDGLVNCEIDEDLYCSHHEADNRILFHISKLPESINVVIRASDTDILIIAVGNLHKLTNKVHIWIKTGLQSKNTLRYVSVNDIYTSLGDILSQALPAYHALTGSDYTASFARKEANPNFFNPEEHGWLLVDGRYQLEWFIGPQTPSTLEEICKIPAPDIDEDDVFYNASSDEDE